MFEADGLTLCHEHVACIGGHVVLESLSPPPGRCKPAISARHQTPSCYHTCIMYSEFPIRESLRLIRESRLTLCSKTAVAAYAAPAAFFPLVPATPALARPSCPLGMFSLDKLDSAI